jgi:hypothetical protein
MGSASKKVWIFQWGRIAVPVMVYAAFWLFTQIWGGKPVKQKVIGEMHLPVSISRLSEISDRKAAKLVRQGYYCEVTSLCPFILEADFGWSTGPLSGAGGSKIFLWVPGTVFTLKESDQWAQ